MRAMLATICLCVLLPFVANAQAEEGTADIIIEADTRTPPFYNGRAEPAAEGTIRAIAIVPDLATPDAYTYVWRVNGQRLSSENQAISFTAPLGNEFRIRVDIYDAEEVRVAWNEMFVPISEPQIVFYEYNLLRGISRTAMSDPYILNAEEVTVHAEPYFMNTSLFSGPHRLRWRVNGANVTEQASGPQRITLRNTGGTGTFGVEFFVQSGVAFGQEAAGRFTVRF